MAQVSGGLLQGMSQARFEKWGYDLRWGVNQNKRLPHREADYVHEHADQLPIRRGGHRGSRERRSARGGSGSHPSERARPSCSRMPIYDAIGDADLDAHTASASDKILNALEGGVTGYTTLQTHV